MTHEETRTAAAALLALPRSAARAAEMFDLAGEDSGRAYRTAAARVRYLRRALALAEADLLTMRAHAHAWSADNYCSICGADGAA